MVEQPHSMLLCGAPHKSLGMRLSTCRGMCPSTFQRRCMTSMLLPYCRGYSLLKVILSCYTSDYITYNKIETDPLKFHLI